MPKFNEFIKGFEEAEEVKPEVEPQPKPQPQPKKERHPVSVYSSEHRHIPMTKTRYVKQGSKWVQSGEPETEIISPNKAQLVLSKQGLPFESSHKLEKRDRFGHSHPADTFSSISPDKQTKTVWNVDYAKGNENYNKATRKAYYDRQRYKRMKQAKQGSFQEIQNSFDEPQTKEEVQEIDADWERSYGPMRFDDWTDIDQIKAMYIKAKNGGASDTAENALERLEELGAVELTPEQIETKLNEEFTDWGDYIYNDLSEEEIAELAAKRTGIPLEQVKEYLRKQKPKE